MDMQRAIIVLSNTSNQTEHRQRGIKLLLKIVSELLVFGEVECNWYQGGLENRQPFVRCVSSSLTISVGEVIRLLTNLTKEKRNAPLIVTSS